MTDTAPAIDPTILDDFEGASVISSGVEIPNAAGGLRDAMKIEPRQFHHGEKVYLVLECDVAKVRFDPIKDSSDLARVHVFTAQHAVIVDADLVRAQLEEQKSRILKAKEEAAGIQRLDFEKTDEELLAEEEAAAAAEADDDAVTPIKGRKASDGS